MASLAHCNPRDDAAATLDRRAADRAGTGEEIVRRRPLAIAVGHRIGLVLVRVACPADAPGQAHPAALLDHVRRLVRGEPQVRRRLERDMLACGEGGSAHGLVCADCRAADVRPDTRQVMGRPEGPLDGGVVR